MKKAIFLIAAVLMAAACHSQVKYTKVKTDTLAANKKTKIAVTSKIEFKDVQNTDALQNMAILSETGQLEKADAATFLQEVFKGATCDLDGDGEVFSNDLTILQNSIADWQDSIKTEEDYRRFDFDGNGIVDLTDVGVFLEIYPLVDMSLEDSLKIGAKLNFGMREGFSSDTTFHLDCREVYFQNLEMGTHAFILFYDKETGKVSYDSTGTGGVYVDTDDQNLSWNPATGALGISDGTGVDLDGRYFEGDELNDLDDVTLTTPDQGDILRLNETNQWVNVPMPEFASEADSSHFDRLGNWISPKHGSDSLLIGLGVIENLGQPAEPLDVNGNAIIRGALNVQNLTNVNSAQFTFTSDSSDTPGYTFANADGYLKFYNGTDWDTLNKPQSATGDNLGDHTATQDLDMAENGIHSADTITADDAIGIGTDSPTTALDVNSPTGANMRLIYNDSDGSPENYADFTTSSTGNLTINSTGNTTTINDKVVVGDTLKGKTFKFGNGRPSFWHEGFYFSQDTTITACFENRSPYSTGNVSIKLLQNYPGHKKDYFLFSFRGNNQDVVQSVYDSSSTSFKQLLLYKYLSNYISWGTNTNTVNHYTYGGFYLNVTPANKGNAALEINETTGNNLRLIYNDNNGSPANYADFLTSSGGDLRITASGKETTIDSNLVVTGTINLPITTLTSDRTLDNRHNTILADNSGAAGADRLDITLPAGSTCPGRIYRIKLIDKGGSGGTYGMTINASRIYLTKDTYAASYSFDIEGGSVTVQSDGTSWWVIDWSGTISGW